MPLHISHEDAFHDLFDIAQLCVWLEDPIRVIGARKGIIYVVG